MVLLLVDARQIQVQGLGLRMRLLRVRCFFTDLVIIFCIRQLVSFRRIKLDAVQLLSRLLLILARLRLERTYCMYRRLLSDLKRNVQRFSIHLSHLVLCCSHTLALGRVVLLGLVLSLLSAGRGAAGGKRLA